MATRITVSPTRMQMLLLRRRIALAQKGYDLLKEKMDALVMELFEALRKLQEARTSALEQLSRAHRSLSVCLAYMGTMETEQAAREARHETGAELSTRFAMGVEVPVVEIGETERKAPERGYSLYLTSSLLDEASREFEKALKRLAEVAELEETAKAIAKELEKTKRRVNALEYVLIPRLKEALKFIMMRLDEMEREHFFRLKRIKAGREARG